jgi:hypothetical protein
MEAAMTGDALYGGRVLHMPTAPATPNAGGHPTAKGDVGDDPHDKSDLGPSGFFDDPTVWLVLFAAAATGIIGARFHVGGNKVNLGDQAAAVAGTTLYAVVGIVSLKVVASKVEIPGFQKLVAAI